MKNKLNNIITQEILRTKEREKFVYDENQIEGNFILTDKARERIQKLYNQLESNIPIMLEGSTGTSKTKTAQVVCKLLGLELVRVNLSSETTIEDLMGKLIADKENSFSGFTYKKGSFAEAYSEGKILLLDEVNLAPNPVLQCMLSALDSDKITQSVPGSGLQTFYRHPNFRIIATQNPKTGSFIFTRDRLSNKFLETFQVIEFPPFEEVELMEIAEKAAIKMNYINPIEKDAKKEKIIKKLGEFHNKWVNSDLSKSSPQCYTVRDLNSSVKAISDGASPNDVISCFYGARYEKEVYNKMQELLKEKFPELSSNSTILRNLPDDFPKCFQSKSLKQAFKFAELGINNGKHLLFVGNEEIGLTQIAKWISYYFSKNKKENFIFIFTPETTVSDLLGRYIPAPQTEEIGNIMIWEDGPLTEAIKNGYSCVFTNLSSAQTKVAERLNGLFDPKDTEEDYKFDLYENSENPVIEINKEFHFISTCNIDKLKYLSPALLNRLMVINIPDQLEEMKENDYLTLIRIILQNEFKEKIKEEEIVKLIYENQKVKNYSMSKLAKFAKSVYRLYNACKTRIDKGELINFTNELLYGEKQITKIPNPIINLAVDLFSKNKQSSTDEKFYFMGSDNLKNLMIIIYSCSICRIPVCLVGPTGLGKTSMARAFSEFTRNEVATMYSFNLETQVDDIFGTFTFKNGKPIIIEGPLTKVLGEGSIFIGDEFNLAEDTILQTLAIAFENIDENSSYLIPGINKKIKFNEKFFFISCQNDLSTTGRKKLPHIIEKRLRTFDYPLPDLKDLKFNCESIIQENIEKKVDKKDKSLDGMRSEINREVQFNLSADKLAKFMFEINNKQDKKYMGNWSMRNIRKILRRHTYQKHNDKSFINVSFELQIMIYILSEVPTEKRKAAFKEVIELLKVAFEMNNELIRDIEEVINGIPKIERRMINTVEKKFLFKGKSGIEIGNDFDELESLTSLMETLFYAKFAYFKEPINFCGPSSYKTFIAKRLSFGADVVNLYSETSIEQLLGSIYLVNNYESKIYYLEKILKINKNEEKLKEYKEIIKNYFEKKIQYETCNDNTKKEELKKKFKNAKNDFDDLNQKIIRLNEEKKKNLPYCIYLALVSLRKKLFEINDENKGIFKDFTSIFKPGILLEKILKQSPIILKNLSNLSTAVLERFNDLFNYNPKLTLNEDFCDTFTGEMKPKEISNFSNNFRVISISTLSGIRNLSDAAKSRFTTIYTSEYDGHEKEIAAKTFLNPKIEGIIKKTSYSIPEKFFEFIKEYEKAFKSKLSFLDIIKILTIYKKIRDHTKDTKVFNLVLAIYFALYSNYDKKFQREKFLKILIELNNDSRLDINELNNLSLKNYIKQKPLEIQDNTLKSNFTKIGIELVKNDLYFEDDEIDEPKPELNKDIQKNISFTTPFNKMINYIHFSLALYIPLIIEGQIGIGKRTAIKYIASILNLKEVYFSISNSTTVEDLFCKTVPIQKESGLEFIESRSKLLDVIDSAQFEDKSLENRIIILDNLQEASNNILESLIPVFDETKNRIFLPNGTTVSKRKFHIIAIFDQTSKGTNIKNTIPNSIRNSSLIFKCENFLEEGNLSDIKEKIIGEDVKDSDKFLKNFVEIYNYGKENHKKELFNLNDFAKFKKISKINLNEYGKNIIEYEILLQILLIYRFTNSEDLKNITTKLGCLLSKDLWPVIEYINIKRGEGVFSHNIKIYPIETKEKDNFFIHELTNYDINKIEDLKRKVFTLTPEQRFGLIFLMISVKSNIPCIIQGPTASGKSYLIKLFCELLGEDPEIIIINNDSGINLLTGQIAPKNEIEYNNILSIKNAIEECKDIEGVYSIFEEDNFKDRSNNWKPKDFNKIIKKLKEKEQGLDRGARNKVLQIEKLLTDELSFLKHLKNEDSPFINALRQGKWVVLDGIESAEPELYERLSTLCDLENKRLNLFEKGPQYEYTMDNKNKEFKIHEKFRLFITYNSYEVEQNKKLSPNFISKCLQYSLSSIDVEPKSSALVLSGLFNYKKTFEENDKKDVVVIKEEVKAITTPEIKPDGIGKKPENKNKKSNKNKNKVKSNLEENSSDDDEDDSGEDNPLFEEEEEEKEEEKREEEKEDETHKPRMEEIIDAMEHEEIKNIFEKKNKDQILLEKKDIKGLAIKLANIHQVAKEFVNKEGVQKFAGQKNFSGRSLKYIFNSIDKKNYDLSEAIVSVLEDCYSNSYKTPREMKEELIQKFFIKAPNYNEIMSYLGRDETDISEKYEPLMTMIDEYVEKQTSFKYKIFLDYLDNLVLKDLEEVKKKFEKSLEKLEEKNIMSEYYIFLRIIYNILTAMLIKTGEENEFAEYKINDTEISKRLDVFNYRQKKYLLLRKLIEKNYYNFEIKYKEYDAYNYSINEDKIEEPFFELFSKKKNIVIDSIMLGLLYPKIEENDNIKLSSIKREMVKAIIILTNNCKINIDFPKNHYEFEIFDTLLYLANSKLFFDSFEIKYTEEQLYGFVNNDVEKKSNEIKKKVDTLNNEEIREINIDKIPSDKLKNIFGKWLTTYNTFNNSIIAANAKKSGDEEKAKIEIEFGKLIGDLNSFEKDDFIERAIKYLEKTDRTEISLKNSQKYVETIKNEYKNKKLDTKKTKSLIRFEFKPEDAEKNFESKLLEKNYKNKFNKLFYSLIKYNESIELVEKIEKSKDVLEKNTFFNKLDIMLNENNETKIFKNGLKIMRKIIIDNDTSIGFQYFKDILLCDILLKYFIIDDSCTFFNVDNIYNEFNRFISRENFDKEDRKFAYYLSNNFPPNYEIFIPSLNVNSILLLFVQKSYKKNKPGLITLKFGINQKAGEGKNFENEIRKFQDEDLTRINLIQGLNRFVDICKTSIFNRDDIKSKVSFISKDQKTIVTELSNKIEEIKSLEGGEYLEKLIMIIKGLYNSCESPRKKFETDDLFFVNNPNWKDNLNNFNKNKYLIYYLFKNQDIETDLREYLLKTECFAKNNKNKFPMYAHILRILSSKNEIKFQGKAIGGISEIFEKILIDKILSKAKEDRQNNLNWIGLLINNTNTEKYLPPKITYLYIYFDKLCQVKYAPSDEFNSFKLVLEKIINFVTDYCFQNKIDDIFKLNIKKEIKENINETENILFLTKLNQIMESELKKREKDEFLKLKNSTIKIINEIEPIKNELNKIYDDLISAIKNDIELEKAKIISENEARIKNVTTDLLNVLTENSSKYSNKFRELKNVENHPNINLTKFDKDVRELLDYKSKLSYFKDIYSSSEKLEYIILNLEEDCDKLTIKNKGEIRLSQDNLNLRVFYLPKKYSREEVTSITKSGRKINKDLYYIFSVEKIDNNAKNNYYEKKIPGADSSHDKIKINLSISEKEVDIDKQKDKHNLLCGVKDIISTIVNRILKINQHIGDAVLDYTKPRLKNLLEGLKEIKRNFEDISLKNPRFLNEEKTELKETKLVCENYENIKRNLLDKFIELLGNLKIYNENFEKIANDKKIVNNSFEFINEINVVNKKEVDFSPFKGFIFKSRYLSYYKNEKKIQTSYETFDFSLGNIIPSLYGNSTFSINIMSFVPKETKAEIIKDSISNKDYLKSFSVSPIIKKNSPLIIKFIVPDKKIEKKEDSETDLNINISGLNSGEINPLVIKNKISFSLIPLSAIIYSKKYDFIWNKDKLILIEDTFKEGISLKINFKILNFEGNYDSFKHNFSLISLEDNNIERPKVGFESDDNSALFKLKIPKLMDDTKNSFHALFSLYISKNLIIPIEIKSKINKRDFGLFYYNKYTNEILNHTSHKEIIIYKYNEKGGNIYVMGRIDLYFRIQCNDNLDEKDDTEHNLTIKVPEGDRLLSFGLTKDEQSKKFKDGTTIKLPITISNFSSQVEYDKLNNYINTKRFEIEFICDGTSKKFTFKFVIEKALAESKIRYLSVPYFIHKGNEFKKLDEINYDDLSKANDIYFNYDKKNYIKKNDKYEIKKIRKKNDEIEFISEECKLIFMIKAFKINHNITIWGPYEDFKQYEKFYYSELDINKANIEKAKKENEEIYFKLSKKISKRKFEDEIKKDFKKIEKMTQFIRYIYSESIRKEQKIQLLVKISQCFEEQDKEKIMNILNDYSKCSDNNFLPIFYHNIIFSIGNIFQNHVLMLKKYNNYLFVLEKKLSPNLIKEFNKEGGKS